MPDDTNLWQHQIESLDRLRGAASAGLKRIVLQAPPGAGKTEIAIELVKSARAKDRSVAFTVPMLTLIDQTVRRFAARGVKLEDIGVMQADHPMTRIGAPVQVCSVQTLARRDAPESNLIIVDECHIRYDVIPQWMAARPDAHFVGLSATPWSRGLADYWEDLQIVSTIQSLIDEGILSPFRTFCPPERPDLKGVHVVAGDYVADELGDVMSDKTLVGDVVKTWLDKAERRPTLVFAVNRAHAAVLTDEFKKWGVRAEYVDADVEAEDRHEFIQGLKTGSVEVIVSISTMTTGVDIPWVSCISFVRPTKSPILFVQSLTRGLRAYPGKVDCLILDHSMTTLKFGLVTDIDTLFKSLKTGKKPDKQEIERAMVEAPLPRECQQCHFIVPPKTAMCPNCGFRAPPKLGIRCEDGELVPVGDRRVGAIKVDAAQVRNRLTPPEDKRRFYGELIAFGESMGFVMPGWANHKYREMYGVWPNKYRDAPPVWPPSSETALWLKQNYDAWRASKQRLAS